MPDDSTFKRQPREYQSPIIQKAITSVQSGSKRLNFVLATGLGKSLVAAEIVRRLWQEQGFRRILVLCHIKDLADQLEVSFWSQLNKNIPTWTFYEGRPPKIADGVNCGLFQTLANKLDLIEPGSFDLILVDEAHHAPAASYRNCLVRLNAKVLIGMTATPWHNLEGAFEDVFGERIATISLPEGMAMGYLARVKYLAHCDNIHWEELHKLSGKNVSIRDLNKKLFIPQRDEAIVQEIKRVCNEMANPRICIFCPSIEHGKRFAALIASRGISCKPLSGADKVERWKSLMEFAYGRIKAVTAVDVLNEGIDVPDVNIVVFLRVTHSHRIFIQQLGRGLRITESKAELEVLDFVTDIRRLAEILELERSRKEAGTSYQEIMLKDEIRFTSNKVKSFMQQWMEDLSQVATTDEEDTLKFPDFSETNEYDS